MRCTAFILWNGFTHFACKLVSLLKVKFYWSQGRILTFLDSSFEHRTNHPVSPSYQLFPLFAIDDWPKCNIKEKKTKKVMTKIKNCTRKFENWSSIKCKSEESTLGFSRLGMFAFMTTKISKLLRASCCVFNWLNILY